MVLRRSLVNLLRNAIESGGDIGVSLKQQEKYPIVKITDSGCGIPKNILDKTMSGEKITHGKSSGRGLGFVYAKYIIQKLGGIIEIESEVEK